MLAAMGKYDPLDRFFADLEGDERRFSLDHLEEVSGVELPSSARTHPAWWSSAQYHAKWKDHGWDAHPRLGQGEVVFTRGAPRRHRPEGAGTAVSEQPSKATDESDSGFILIGCVGQKRTEPAPARDLYTSLLWQKRRHYAEGTGKPWMVLSAEHGLLDPSEVIAPYDRALASEPRAYREQWSGSTADAVITAANRLGVRKIEAHAGAAYLENGLIRALEEAGLTVTRPLVGLRIGEQYAWYTNRSSARGEDEATDQTKPSPPRRVPARPITADHVLRIAADYADGLLGESWGALPENRVHRLPDATSTEVRLWLTFICSVDRARNAEALWAAGLEAWESERWVFDPNEVATRPFWRLAEVLRSYRLSQRHAQDASSWRMIGESLAADDCPEPIRAAIVGGPADAAEVLDSLGGTHPAGTRRFPLLSGPKIGVLWVRVLAYPGGAEITGIEVVPVAVDTHVQRVTEMLGLVAPRELDERHRREIQEVWFAGVRESGPFGGPAPIDGTAAALDPALWVLGKNGCSRCERAGRKIEIGSICELCPLGRIDTEVTAPSLG